MPADTDGRRRHVLILLPPSEGKARPSRGRPLDLDRLSFPGLAESRRRVLDSLVDLCAGDAETARTVLGLTSGQSAEVARNADLWQAPTATAARVYTGVLYEALDLASLTPVARRRAASWVAIASAAFGLLRIGDRIPAYRLSGGTSLPGLDPLATVWRPPVTAAIREAVRGGLLLDLRSGSYVSLAPVPPDLAPRTVVARVLLEREGRRSVVSHANKATKGRLVRSLVESGDRARTPADLAGICGALGFHVELSPPVRDDRPWTADVVVRAT